MPSSPPRALIWGLDWSGARRPGRAAWAARGCWEGEALHIEALEPLDTWAGPPRLDRPAMLRFLSRAALAAAPVTPSETSGTPADPLFIGIDAPFSLADEECEALGASSDLDLVARLPSLCPDPEALRAAVRRSAEARQDGRLELRRPVDQLAKTPMAPGNLRLYRQTWAALCLAHRLRAGGARLLPWQPPTRRGVHLLEVCPASLWRSWGLDARGYKGADPEGVRGKRRQRLLDGLRRALPLRLPPQLAAVAVEQTGGDALDALAVAVGTVRYGLLGAPEAHARLATLAPELGGWVYGGAELPPPE